MKILLLSYTGQPWTTFAYIPLGISYVSAALKEAGHDVTVLDADLGTVSYDPKEYDLIGLSAKAGKSLRFILDHIKEIRETSETRIVVGGPLVTAMPERWLKETQADYIIQGEGEITMVRLANAIANGNAYGEIPGLGFHVGKKIKVNPIEYIQDLDTIPRPDFEAFDIEHYLSFMAPELTDRHITLFTSRGCPYGCKFCSRPFGVRWKGQSPKKVYSDLKYFVDKYKVKSVYFHDDNFMYHENRVKEICKLIKPLNIKWGCEARAHNIKKEIVRAMKDAGCVWIRLGLESGSPDMLKAMNKGITLEISKRAVQVLVEEGVAIKAGFMVGMPGETIRDAKLTLKFIRWIYKQDNTAILFMYHYTPRPNTEWYWLAVSYGMDHYSLEDWAKLDKYEQTYYNMSMMKEKQINRIIFTTLVYDALLRKNGIWRAIRFFYRKVIQR